MDLQAKLIGGMTRRARIARLLRDIRAHWMLTKMERRNRRKMRLGGGW